MTKELDHAKAEIERIKAEYVQRTACRDQHIRSDKDMDEIKVDLKYIKKLLMDRLPPVRGGE